jgi:hypothetical protein
MNVLNSKVVGNQGKHDGVPLVSLESRGGDGFIVFKFGKVVSDEVVC